jgi:hypothetical protein
MIICPTCQQSVRRYSDGSYSKHYANNLLCSPDFIYDPYNTDEHTEQKFVIEWARSHIVQYPVLEWLHSSLNGIPLAGSKRTRGRIMNHMKAEGMTKGIPDLFLPVACKGFHGIYLEVKRVHGGVLSKEQKAFRLFAKEQGYLDLVCLGHKAGIANLEWYLSEGE